MAQDKLLFLAIAVLCLALGLLEVAYYYDPPHGPSVIHLKR
jgi:hypothetical protein